MPPRSKASAPSPLGTPTSCNVESIMALVPASWTAQEEDGIVVFDRQHLAATDSTDQVLLGGLQALAFACVSEAHGDVCAVALQTHARGAKFYFANNSDTSAIKEHVSKTLIPRLIAMAGSDDAQLSVHRRFWGIEVLSFTWKTFYHRNTRRSWTICDSRLSAINNPVGEVLRAKINGILKMMHAINARADSGSRLSELGGLYDNIDDFQRYVFDNTADLATLLSDADRDVLSYDTIKSILNHAALDDAPETGTEELIVEETELTSVKRSYSATANKSDVSVTRFVARLSALANHALKLAAFASSDAFRDQLGNVKVEYCEDTKVLVNLNLEQALVEVCVPGEPPKFRIRKGLRSLQPSRSYHAEMKVAVKVAHDTLFAQEGEKYHTVMGSSKLCCYGCSTFFNAWNEVFSPRADPKPADVFTPWITSGTHGKVYLGYVKPDMSSLDRKLALRLDTAFKNMVIDDFRNYKFVQHTRFLSDSTSSPPVMKMKPAIQTSEGAHDKSGPESGTAA